MSDINSQEMQRFLDLLEQTGSKFAKIAKNQESADASREAAAKQLDRDLKRRLDGGIKTLSDGIRTTTEGFDSVVNNLQNSVNRMFGGAAIGLMIARVADVTKTYREMTNVGQTFGGSMQKMMMAAAAAGLPLNEFARVSIKANAVIGQTGSRLFDVQKQLRKNIEVNGLYGMSISDITNFTAEYMDVSRQNGSLMTKTTGQTANELQELTLQTTILASASDKTREQIMQLGMKAASATTAIATIQGAPIAMRAGLDERLKKSTTFMAAQVGEAGEYLSALVANSFGSSSAYTAEGKTAIEAGMGQVASAADDLARKIKNGTHTAEDDIKFQKFVRQEYENNIKTLQWQAASGNQAADAFIRMASQIKVQTSQEIAESKRRMKAEKGFSQFLLSLDSIFNRVVGAFNTGFLTGFNKFADKMTKLGDKDWAKRLADFAEKLGTKFGELFGSVFTDDNIDRMATGMLNIGEALFTMAEAIVNAQWLFEGIGTALSWASKTLGLFTGSIAWIDEKLGGGLHNAVAGLIAFGFAVKVGISIFKGIQMLKNLFGRGIMSVRAAVVNVTGGTVNDGGGGGGGDSGGRRRGRRGGRFGRFGRLGGKLLGGGFRRGAGMAVSALGAVGGLGGVAKGLGGGLGIGAALESLEYLSGARALNWRNLGKSALSVGGGAIGGIFGSAGGPVGTVAGGMAGYAGGKWLGDAIFGDDSVTNNPMASNQGAKSAKASAATAAGAAAGAAAAAGMAEGPVPSARAPNTDQLMKMVEAQEKTTKALETMMATLTSKLDTANGLLKKIENNS